MADSDNVDFDHHSKDLGFRRFEVYKKLRHKCPVVHSKNYGGFWFVSTYAGTREVFGNPAAYSSARAVNGDGGVTIPPAVLSLIPVESDEPFHGQLRRALNPWFMQKNLSQIEDDIRAIVRGGFDKAIAKGEFDIVTDIASVIPPTVILTILGIPLSQRGEILEDIYNTLYADSTKVEGTSSADGFARLSRKMIELFDSRRTEPQDDLATFMTQIETPALTNEQLLEVVFVLLTGGSETTAALICNALPYLAQDHALRQQLIEQPQRIPDAIEEMLRFHSPANHMGRITACPVNLGGAEVGAGERVLVGIASANHDESVFENPEIFDINRKNKRDHLSFGFGPHFCLGNRIARLEMRLVLEELLSRIPNYTVDMSRAVLAEDNSIVQAYTSIPARTGLV